LRRELKLCVCLTTIRAVRACRLCSSSGRRTQIFLRLIGIELTKSDPY